MRTHKKIQGDMLFDIFSGVIFIFAILVALYPFFWMVLNAFRKDQELFFKPLQLPEHYSFTVYADAWKQANYTAAFRNSSIITASSVLLILATASLAAFVLARVSFPGRTFIRQMFTSSIIISGQVILIPLFFIVKGLGLNDQLPAVIFAGSAMGLPISIILLYGFFIAIPMEIQESTYIDGCPRFVFFIKFILPLSKPIIATLIIFQSLWSWNEYLYALTFLKSEEVRTIPLQLTNFFTMFKTEWSKLFAALTIAVFPLLILYLVLQKYFIKGLTAGAVKM